MRFQVGAIVLVGLVTACQTPTRPVMLSPNRNDALASTYGLPEDSRATAQRAFEALDKDGDGYLSVSEYVAGTMGDYKEADAAAVSQHLVAQFAKYDRNHDQRLSFTEYLGN